jgi:NADH-quinone oxidoreductase subunit N
MTDFYTAQDHFVVLPAIMLALFGCAVLLFDVVLKNRERRKQLVLTLTFVGLAFTAASLFRQHSFLVANSVQEVTGFGGSLIIDRFAIFFNWIFLASSAIVSFVSYRVLAIEKEPLGEFYGLLLLGQAGMFFLATGTDLITIATGLELMSLSFYILVGFVRSDKRSNEAALKFMLLGAFSTAFLLYGFSLLYGLSGSTKTSEIAVAVSTLGAWNPVVFCALATTSVGLLFKVSAVPFHMWAPDAYEGAPTPATAYLAVASKSAALALLVRLFLGPLASARSAWEPLLIAVAIASLLVGNLAAITQDNVKRLLAYSSIAHVGYILLGLVAGNTTGVQGITVYILVYTFMTLGAFLVIAALRSEGQRGDTIDDLRGLIHRQPGYAVWMLIFLMSLAGIPPTAGFLGKYYIFWALVETGHYVLATLGAVLAAVSLFYYFRIVRIMFLNQEESMENAPVVSRSFGFQAALGLSGALTLAIGLYPEPFLRFAQVLGAVN